MCGRYRCSTKTESLIEEYNIEVDEWYMADYSPQDQVYPTQYSPILLNDHGKNTVKPMHWGLIPFWCKDRKYASKMINARAETIQEKASFKNLVQRNRCVVITNGYYEWKTESSKKVPYCVHSANDGFLPLAGLWDKWKSSEGEIIESFTIITKSPIEKLKSLHHRMPVLLNEHTIKSWISENPFTENMLLTQELNLNITPADWI